MDFPSDMCEGALLYSKKLPKSCIIDVIKKNLYQQKQPEVQKLILSQPFLTFIWGVYIFIYFMISLILFPFLHSFLGLTF